MNITTPNQVGHAHIVLQQAEELHVFHPKSIIAYQGLPQLREDLIMNLANVFRKRKWIRSHISGPSEFIIGLPPGCTLETIPIGEHSDLLFDYKHVLFYSEGISVKPVIQRMRNIWITRELVRMRFNGPGTLGIMTKGDMKAIQLKPDCPLYVETTALIAYPENAAIKLSVYGNKLASQHMQVQWEITGSGPVLVQTGSTNTELEEQLQSGSLIRRLLRELLPFGGVYIK